MAMKKGYDKIELIGLEMIDPMRFRAIFEIPGKYFDQPYPKRGSHTFRARDKELFVHDDGEPEFCKRLKELYVDDVRHCKRTMRGEAITQEMDSINDFAGRIQQLNKELTRKTLYGDTGEQ